MLDESKVKPYITRAKPPPSNTLPIRCSTFLLLSPLVIVYFHNDLIIDYFYRDKFKNRFIVQ
jgi:hypothetical protein